MLPLDACVDRPAAGHKAVTLARLRAAGLPVLDGVVIEPGEPVDEAALQAALARLSGEAFAVRSSATVEDRPGLSAAGVFESVIGARGVGGVLQAIAHVRASAEAEPARAYLRARGADERVQMAVLVQPVVRAARLGVALSAGDLFLVEERAAGEPEWGDVEARRLPRDDAGALAALLRAVEALVGGPVAVELAREGETLTLLQARPLEQAPSAAHDEAAFAVAGTWRLDAEHNPDPLSAAQAGLVGRVEALAVGAPQRVLGGYLYVARGAPARGLSPIPVAELRRRFDEELAPDAHARLAAAEEAGTLAAALAAYDHVYTRYVGEVTPSLQRARAQLDQLLRANLHEPLQAHGALLAGLGGATLARDQLLWELGTAPPVEEAARLRAYLERFGMLAPAWDVAVPPDDEAPARVREAAQGLARAGRSPLARHADAVAQAEAAAHALLERLDRMARRALKALLPLVREALPVGEDDDVLFFRAQRVVRRAMRALGATLASAGALDAPDDVLDLPLPDAIAAAAGDRSLDLRAHAAAGRAAQRAAARHAPPLAIDDGVPRWPSPEGQARQVLRGLGTDGRAQGRAVVVRALADAPPTLPEDAVLIVPALLPSLAYLLPGARALVTDHGGATSHAALLAREYGVPAVLGTRHATALPDGAAVYVDAAAGRVYRL